MSLLELMAPAGSYESLHAAINAGADSVYFGIEQLNMRVRSCDFTLKDLKPIHDVCAEGNVKTYLTLNTVLYDHDIALMKEIVDEAHRNHIRAIIACDHAILNYAKEVGMPVHLSTQANASNFESVLFFSQFADAIVLARELSLAQVEYIVKKIQQKNLKGPSGELIKIEIFGHGALCMAISGKCYLSLHSHYASANRGACIQNCRRSYVVTDKEEGMEFEIDNAYIMSAKDLCTIDFLDQIIRSGVNILKIEGRGRSADYVYTVTKCYREAIDAYYKDAYNASQIENWKTELATVFNRGFWDGYYLGKKMGEWSDIYGSKATRKKIYLGKGQKYFPDIGVGEFRMESNKLSKGDDILISGPSSGVIYAKAEELRVNGLEVDEVKKGDYFSMPIKEKIRPSDKLYKIINAE